MKKAVFLFLILMLLVIGGMTLRGRSEEKSSLPAKKPVAVKTQTVGSSQEVVLNFSYPAKLKSEKEVFVKAKSSGQVKWLNFAIGEIVSEGEILAKIDAAGNLTLGENDFLSNQIRQQEFLVKQAKENYALAKERYREKASDENKSAKKVAKLQYQAAQNTLQNLLNDGLLTAPLTGTVVEKLVVVGDVVSVGQPLAKISQLGKIRAQFFVDEVVLRAIKKGDLVEIELEKGERIQGRLVTLSPEADSATKKFFVEADISPSEELALGTLATVHIEIRKKVDNNRSFFLPLSAVTVGQNENFVFLADNGRAKKQVVKILEISGERVLVEADLDLATEVIVEGNKQVQEGSEIIDKQ